MSSQLHKSDFTVLHMIVRVNETQSVWYGIYHHCTMYTRDFIQAGFMRQQELLKLLLENISSAQTTQVLLQFK